MLLCYTTLDVKCYVQYFGWTKFWNMVYGIYSLIVYMSMSLKRIILLFDDALGKVSQVKLIKDYWNGYVDLMY